MVSVKLLLWNYFFSYLPVFAVRKLIFRYIMRNRMDFSSSIHRGLDLFCVGGVEIGRRCTINKYASLDGRSKIVIGNSVSISAYSKLITGSHDVNSVSFSYIGEPIIIEDYVWVGTAAIILPGVKLSKGCVVGAGSVVTTDVPEYTIVAGNPARVIGTRRRELNYDASWEPWGQ